jgi:hypothetical protein
MIATARQTEQVDNAAVVAVPPAAPGAQLGLIGWATGADSRVFSPFWWRSFL